MKKLLCFRIAILLCIVNVFTIDVVKAQCAVNGGLPESYICYTNDTIFLNGSVSNDIVSNSWVWTIVSQPGAGSINVPSSLTTYFTDNTVTGLAVGVYEFALTAQCSNNFSFITNTITVTVMPAATQAVITDTLGISITADTVNTCNGIYLDGNLPAAGEIASWSMSTTLIYTSTSPHFHAWSWYCQTPEAYYTITNGGCYSIDSLSVNISMMQNVSISSHDTIRTCDDSVHFTGYTASCLTTHQWALIESPAGVTLPWIQSPTSQSTDIIFYHEGYYTFTYYTTSYGPCLGDSDTVVVWTCGQNMPNAGGTTKLYYCDSIPDTIPIVAPWFDGFFYDWYVYPPLTASDVVQISGIDTSANMIHIIVPEALSATSYSALLTLRGDTCINETDTLPCNASINFYVGKYLHFTLEHDTVNYFCGGPIELQAWNQFSMSGGGTTTSTYLISAPAASGYVPGPYNNSQLFNLTAEGQYAFMGLSFAIVAGDTICSDTAYMVYNVASPDPPNAGTNANVNCFDEIVTLLGSDPGDPSVPHHWIQLDGNPPVTFVDGTDADDIEAHITFSGGGTYSFEYSFSQSPDCYLADTTSFTVGACSGPQCGCGGWIDLSIYHTGGAVRKTTFIQCEITYEVSCTDTFAFPVSFACSADSCLSTIVIEIIDPFGNLTTYEEYSSIYLEDVIFDEIGLYTMNFYAYCNGIQCGFCTIQLNATCDDPTCCRKWIDNSISTIYDNGFSTAYIPIDNGDTKEIMCNTTLSFSMEYECKESCSLNAQYSFEILDPFGNVFESYTSSAAGSYQTPDITFLIAGTYTVNVSSICGGDNCNTYTYYINVTCEEKDCCGKWINTSIGIVDIFGNIINDHKVKCGSDVKVRCNKPMAFSFDYNCKFLCGLPSYYYEIRKPNGSLWLSNSYGPTNAIIISPVAFSLPGTYTLTVYAICSDDTCGTCTYNIKTDCVKEAVCCGTWSNVSVGKYVSNVYVASKNITCADTISLTCGNLAFHFDYDCDAKCSSFPVYWGKIMKAGGTVLAIYPAGSPMSHFNTPAFTNITTGVIRVMMYVSCDGDTTNPCDSCIIYFRCKNALKIGDDIENVFTLIPNPASSEVKVTSTEEHLKTLKLFSSDGKLVMQYDHLNTYDIVLNVAMLPKGIYIVKVNDIYVKQLVIMY